MKIETSIVIPFYKNLVLLKKALKSIKKQSYKNYEIIIIYDNPHDHSLLIEPLHYITEYASRFYNVHSLYHPHEIFASILTNMIFDNLLISNYDQQSFNILFKQLSHYF